MDKWLFCIKAKSLIISGRVYYIIEWSLVVLQTTKVAENPLSTFVYFHNCKGEKLLGCMHASLSDNAISHSGQLQGISPACVTSAMLGLKIQLDR